MEEPTSRLQVSLSVLNQFFSSQAFLWVPLEVSEPVVKAFNHISSSIEGLYSLPKDFSADLKSSIKSRYKQSAKTPKAQSSQALPAPVALKSFKTSKILRRLRNIVDMHQSLDLYLIFRTTETRWHNAHTLVFSRWAACNYWKKEPYLMFTAKKHTSATLESGELNTRFLKQRRNPAKSAVVPPAHPRASLLISAQMTVLADNKNIRRSGYYVMLRYSNRIISGYFSQWKVVTAVHSFISPWTRTQHIITQAGDNYIASYYAIKHAVCCFRRMSRGLLLRSFFKWQLKTPRLPNYQSRQPRRVIGQQEEDSARMIEAVKKKLEADHADIFSYRNRS
jgi:hypothetical protein